jgi:dethiobiotin synthetase
VPRAIKHKPGIVFVTGTDTGVGKTVLTALLLSHLRQSGSGALALKPFCSGGRTDAELLHGLQDDDLSLNEINPFYFPEPIAPLVAARKHRRQIQMNHVLQHIDAVISRFLKIENRKSKIENLTLLIEGAGGLLAPLGEGFTFLDLILALSGNRHRASSIRTIIVAPNRLGTINHTLLTADRLRAAKIRRFKVVLMDTSRPDTSSHSNAAVLAELLAPNPVESIPFLGRQALRLTNIGKNSKRLADILARISEPAHL